MGVNVMGVFLGTKRCTPLMREQGQGSVINLSSVAGLVGVAGHTCYGASKGAVHTNIFLSPHRLLKHEILFGERNPIPKSV